MDTLEKAEITALISHIATILKSGIPIYNSEVPNTSGRKTRRRTTQAMAKRYEFHANAIINDLTVCSFNNPLHDVAQTRLFRSSHQRCSVRKGVLKKFHKIQRKTPVPESLF